jgi:ElaB/YqjD/DUF883 family membrane-anchored ribosome-binding protein
MFARVTGRSRAQARRAAQVLNRHPTLVANEELGILIGTVEELVDRLATAADPELKRLRERAEGMLADARSVIAASGAQARERAQALAEQGEAHVREYPWASLGVVVLCAIALGLWTARAVTAD